MYPASNAVAEVAALFKGEPAFITGSAAAASYYQDIDEHTAYSDIDVFVATPNALIACVEIAKQNGFKIAGISERVYQRWLKTGNNGWHTNSIRLEGPNYELNIIHKLVNRSPVTSLAQVIESFDFGLLAVGHDCSTNTWRDMRSYLFPNVQHYDFSGCLPFMPNKEFDWNNGFISRYNGVREATRYVKYLDYGYDMHLVQQTLLNGYRIAGDYHQDKDDKDDQKLGDIYHSIADAIQVGRLQELRDIGKELVFKTDLDRLMEILE